MTERPLNERQERFCAEYVRLGVGSRAAAEAGYRGSDVVLGITAARLLKDDRVCSRIKELGAATKSAKVMDRQEREELLTQFARGQEAVEPRDRLKAIELLAKMHGDLIEKREHSGPKGGPLKSETTVKVDLATAVRIARGAKEGGE